MSPLVNGGRDQTQSLAVSMWFWPFAQMGPFLAQILKTKERMLECVPQCKPLLPWVKSGTPQLPIRAPFQSFSGYTLRGISASQCTSFICSVVVVVASWLWRNSWLPDGGKGTRWSPKGQHYGTLSYGHNPSSMLPAWYHLVPRASAGFGVLENDLDTAGTDSSVLFKQGGKLRNLFFQA